ncbi:type IV pilus modification PilV family protein [Haloferula rosea]|uniref:Type II secretion system protein n=1 Tax=Haloferula rosea TaxID=490093 RepID=A0A934VE60_9BACT|nr:type II secretion system protein [Haloferula rosea]MBK1826969.1 type II secretion system protein [Haloferula rosea]
MRTNRGFTLMETVIAIGVLAVLLTAFLAVFAPAAQGIRKAISVQEADRLAYTLERELVTLRSGDSDDYKTGFEKAYEWIIDSNDSSKALLIYQYRGDPNSLRSDGTMEPYTGNGVAGQDFIVQPVVRPKDSTELEDDLKAIEGRVYTVQMTQLVFNGGQLAKGTAGEIVDPTPGDGDSGGGSGVDGYPEAVIAFAAEFYAVPNSSYSYITTKINAATFANAKPIFTRNLAVRR